MKFLVDQNLSPTLAALLRTTGHDVVHTGDIDLDAGAIIVVEDESIRVRRTPSERLSQRVGRGMVSILSGCFETSGSEASLTVRRPRRGRTGSQAPARSLPFRDLDSPAGSDAIGGCPDCGREGQCRVCGIEANPATTVDGSVEKER